MSDYEIRIEGDKELMAALGKVDLASVLEPPLERGITGVVADLATYPPAPTGSTYVRTGTLGRRWVVTRGTMMRQASNNTDYARLVQDRDEQVAVHRRTGWPTAQGMVEKRLDAIEQDVETSLERALPK